MPSASVPTIIALLLHGVHCGLSQGRLSHITPNLFDVATLEIPTFTPHPPPLMRAARRILVSQPSLARRVPASISHRAHISSVASSSATSSSSQPSRPRGRALNSSLAVEAGLNSNLVEEGILASRSTSTNHAPNRESVQVGTSGFHDFPHCSNLNLSLSEHVTPLQQYRSMIDKGILRGDDHQTRIIQKLQDLHDKLVDYQPPEITDASESNNLVSWYSSFHRIAKSKAQFPCLAISVIQPRNTHTYVPARVSPERSLFVWRCRHRKDNAHGSLLPNPPTFPKT